MYVCKPGLLQRGICWLIMLALLPEIAFCLYMLTRCAFDERTLYLGGAIIFGALFVMLARRLVVLGAAWLEYDDEKVIFHLNRDEEETVPWAEMPSKAVAVQQNGKNILFRFLPAGPEEREVQLLVAPMFSGYRDFRQECERRGVLQRHIIKFSTGDCEEIFQAFFGDEETLEQVLDEAERLDEEKGKESV